MSKEKSVFFDANPAVMSPQKLAFLGDAVFELFVRNKIVAEHSGKIGSLNKIKVKNVCCEAQSELFEKIKDNLSKEELEVYKQGRNSHAGAVPKKSSPAIYHRATGLEALFGFLYLSGKSERILQLVENVNL